MGNLPMLIQVVNDGRSILSSNYWQSSLARANRYFISVNAHAFRLLLPPTIAFYIREMHSAHRVIVSRGPWPAAQNPDALELLFVNGSDYPFAIHADVQAVDRLPRDSSQADDWIFSVWLPMRNGRPNQVFERPDYYRRVTKIPCLRPLE